MPILTGRSGGMTAQQIQVEPMASIYPQMITYDELTEVSNFCLSPLGGFHHR